MAIAIMLSITFIWLAVDPNFDKVKVPALLALFVFPFILLLIGSTFGMI